jgi:hypothetical protein
MPSSVLSVIPRESASAVPNQEPSVSPRATPGESPSEFQVLFSARWGLEYIVSLCRVLGDGVLEVEEHYAAIPYGIFFCIHYFD